MRNYFHVDNNGSVEAKLGPLYFTTYSQIEYDPADGEGNNFHLGFTDIYLDLPGVGLLHAGLGSNAEGTIVLERMKVF